MSFLPDPVLAAGRVRNYVEQGLKIAVVVPCFRVENQIECVVSTIPDYVWRIILVNDASPDNTRSILDRIQNQDPKVVSIHLSQNCGVGGAVLKGFSQACREGAHIVVKIDGDGQMDPSFLPLFVEPLVLGKADYAKGNRFVSSDSQFKMPVLRRFGNASLSFLNKFASGYWNIFDPTNGYLAMRKEIFEALPHSRLSNRYFFESSILIAMGMIGGVVVDVHHPPRYRNEISNLNILHVLFEFPFRLLAGFFWRFWNRKVLYSLSMEAVLSFVGCFLILVGGTFGIAEFINWALIKRQRAPAGTVMTAALPIFLGFQMLMNAILLDIQSVHTRPLCQPLNFDNP